MPEDVEEKFKEGDKVTVMHGRAPAAVFTVARRLKRYFETQDGSKWDPSGRAYPRPTSVWGYGGRSYLVPWNPEHSEQLKLAAERRYVEDRIRTGHAVTPELWLKFAQMLRENAEKTKKVPEVEDER